MILKNKQIFYKNKKINEVYYKGKKVYGKEKKIEFELRLNNVYMDTVNIVLDIPYSYRGKKFIWETDINNESRNLIHENFLTIPSSQAKFLKVPADTILPILNGNFEAVPLITMTGEKEIHKKNDEYIYINCRLKEKKTKEEIKQLIKKIDIKFKITFI